MFKNFKPCNAKRKVFSSANTIIPKSKSAYLQNLSFEGKISANKTPEPNSPATFTFPPKTFNFTLSGKNLANATKVYENNTSYISQFVDGRKCVRFIDDKDTKNIGGIFKPSTQYTVTVESKVVPNTNGSIKTSNIFSFYYTDGTRTDLIQTNNAEWTTLTLTSRADKTLQFIGTTSWNYVNYVYINIDKFIVEEGARSTGFEPYFYHFQSFDLQELLDYNDNWNYFGDNKIICRYDSKALVGDEEWHLLSSNADTLTFGINQPVKSLSTIYCNYFEHRLEQNYTEGVFIGEELQFTVFKNRLDAADINGFKAWLLQKKQQSLPVVIIYEKKQPKIIEVPFLQANKLTKFKQFHTNNCFAKVSTDNIIATFNAVSYDS